MHTIGITSNHPNLTLNYPEHPSVRVLKSQFMNGPWYAEFNLRNFTYSLKMDALMKGML